VAAGSSTSEGATGGPVVDDALGARRQLDAAALAKLSTLQLRVRSVVEGTMSGLHRAPHRGSSIEFAEHKEYSPGDDLRHLDWKALGRFDRYYIRQFENETDLRAYLLLDCSGSMAYGEPLSKLDYGCVLVGTLAYLLAGQRDQPGLVAFDERVRSYIPPRARRGHSAALLKALAQLRPRGKTDFTRAVEHLSEVMHRRSLVIVVSDLFDTHERALPLLRRLRARGHQIVLFQLLHRDELEFPFGRVLLFESLEDQRRVLVDAAGMRQSYLQEMERFCTSVEASCRESQITYRRMSTADPLDLLLAELLRRRMR
jgi:uncharacterized protein (DUF58 family)